MEVEDVSEDRLLFRRSKLLAGCYVRVFEEEGNCIVCLEMRADKLMRRLISGELTNYSVVRTSLESLHVR
jgi:hypothetical protein